MMCAMKRVVVVLPLTPVTATIGMRPFSLLRKQTVDDRLAHLARLAGRRLQMHPQSRARIDLHHHAPLAFQRPADVRGHDVHARDVQAHDAGRVDRTSGNLGVNQIGHVGRGTASAQVGIAANQHLLSRGRHRVGRVSLLARAPSTRSDTV